MRGLARIPGRAYPFVEEATLLAAKRRPRRPLGQEN